MIFAVVESLLLIGNTTWWVKKKEPFSSLPVPLEVAFATAETGTWRYRIREQASSSNTNEASSGNIVELGFMYLDESTTFAPTEYSDQDNEFKTYDGE